MPHASRPAAGGGRRVRVDPDRLPRWFDGFARRHGAGLDVAATATGIVVTAPDGARAECWYPPAMEITPPADGPVVDGAAEGPLAAFVAAVRVQRWLGLLVVRRAGVAVAVADGERLDSSKVDSHYVQGRTAAGGWSQQRFARRRANQTRSAVARSAEVAARVLLPAAGRLAAVVGGGDRRMVNDTLADPALAPLAALRAERFLDAVDPKRAALLEAARGARAVEIRITDPD